MAALETQPAETSDNADADDGIVDDGGESETDGDDNVEVSDNDSEMIIMDPDHVSLYVIYFFSSFTIYLSLSVSH